MKQQKIHSWAAGVLVLLALAFSSSAQAAPKISYRLSMPEPQTHYFEVEMRLEDFKGKNLDLTLPVWAPGSYLIREFPKNVEAFQAFVGSNQVSAQKIDKNTWRVASSGKDVTVKYKVYAFELSVRTSFIDASHGYLNGTSVFMYPEGQKDLPSTVTVVPYKGWSKVSTGLPAVNGQPFTYRAQNYDILADSPFEIGNHEILSFESNGVKHEVAMYGDANYDAQRLTADMKKVTEEAAKVFGELPVNYYLFIVHNLAAGGGGLEHLNSTTLHATRTAYGTERGYKGFLNLVAHEYFHLWNVKRLRPIELGPFDYNQENYSKMLWVSEGFTSYYADVIMKRAGFTSDREYADKLAASITSVENTPGNKVVSAAQSSFDAWIKQYRPDENSYNTHLSYYSKGSLLGMLLDMEILKASNGTKSLDDAMKALYDEYYKKKKRGFTEKEFQQGIEKFTNRSMNDFFQKYVYGLETPDYNAFLSTVGITLTDLNQGTKAPLLGAGISTASGKPVVTTVTRNGSAWQSGLNVNDEIIGMNGYRVSDDINKSIPAYAVGDQLELVINRSGQLMILPVTLLKDHTLKYHAEMAPAATDLQKKSYQKWTSAK
ncbi:M61 family metallopeptidase [Rufibacter sediminis]|uniref:M61 family metallopeptidase n=1 Tax=Rufibacter sediminis TaxID=2762756 RepID=A0ABR6VLH5_9BACT|nr:PDZ domain-containing protein [Rufibacter sediminis]MBC3538048.1 M61 family metallopeptidase [Rufibacter sediminis]